MEDTQTGKTCSANVALAASKKTAKAKLTVGNCNPRGTLKKLILCMYYYTLYYTVLGQTSVASKQYGAKQKTKNEQKFILTTLQKMQIDEDLVLLGVGKSKSLRVIAIYYHQFHKSLFVIHN